jgi:hypothetical protein
VSRAFSSVISPQSLYADNKYDPLADSIMLAVNLLKRTAMYVTGEKHVEATIKISFVRFGSEGDREEPNVTLEINSHE